MTFLDQDESPTQAGGKQDETGAQPATGTVPPPPSPAQQSKPSSPAMPAISAPLVFPSFDDDGKGPATTSVQPLAPTTTFSFGDFPSTEPDPEPQPRKSGTNRSNKNAKKSKSKKHRPHAAPHKTATQPVKLTIDPLTQPLSEVPSASARDADGETTVTMAPVADASTQTMFPPVEPGKPEHPARTASGTKWKSAPGGGASPVITPPSVPVKDEADEEDGDAAEHAKKAPKEKKSHAKLIAIIVVAVLVVGAGVGGFLWWNATKSRKAQEAALSSCQSASESYDAAIASLKKTISSNEALGTTAASKVSDPAVITTLQKALKDGTSLTEAAAPRACTAQLSTAMLQQTANDFTTAQSKAADVQQQISNAATALTDSMKEENVKVLQDALNSAIDDAQETYDTTAGQVADETTRETLLSAIADAKKVAAKSDLTQKDVDKSTAALDTAVADVKASETQKANDDAEAAYQQQLAEQQAQQQAQQQQQNSTYGYDTGTTGSAGTDDGTGTTDSSNSYDTTGNTGTGTDASIDTSGTGY